MSRNLPSGYNGVTVLPTATVQRAHRGRMLDVEIRAVHLDSNENMFGDPLHEVHGVTVAYGEMVMWFETTDSLKALFEDALGND